MIKYTKKAIGYCFFIGLTLSLLGCSHLPDTFGDWGADLSSFFNSGSDSSLNEQKVEIINSHFDDSISNFFTDALESEQQFFKVTPWGSDITLMAERRYHSAGGHNCIAFEIVGKNNNNEVSIACEVSKNNWVEVRPVIKMDKIY